MKKIKALFTGILCFSVVMFASGQTQKGPIEAGENIAVVTTKYGKVRGYIDDGIFAFKGIPYAQAERFMPPKAPDNWEGTKLCQIFGPQAMQPTAQDWEGQGEFNFGFLFNREPMDEQESFVLNVWSKGINDGKKRPVWVWIHGGGYFAGSANQLPFFDGRPLAEKGDIVVVSINHRLNALGYVDLSFLGDKYSDSVNLGMQDIVAALEWVRDNISNFGGDPNTVTINGQSGGGGKVSTLMAMPSAAGLFKRAIVQSGSTVKLQPQENATAFGKAYAAALAVTPNNTEKLDNFSYEELLEAGSIATRVLKSTEQKSSGQNFRIGYSPTVDGKFIVQNPFDPEPAPFSKDVAMLMGSDLNEFTYFNRNLITKKTLSEVRDIIAERFGKENVDKYIELYRKAYPNSTEPHEMLGFDIFFRSGVLKQAAAKSKQGGAPAYMYLFTWKSPVNDGSLGACHGMELPFMFNNIEMARTMTGGTKEAYILADKISSAWINFVKTGNPNTEKLPKWAPYNSDDGDTMIFDNNCEIIYNHDKELIEFLSTFPSTRLF
ncbi:carboxylesterase/lipase family protein [Flavisericum labens]|uniref:carboxylesterase/lipase family protein n=1 Tax=Flavisericum labens TaxID=3377112 RepID=UPI00387A933C